MLEKKREIKQQVQMSDFSMLECLQWGCLNAPTITFHDEIIGWRNEITKNQN